MLDKAQKPVVIGDVELIRFKLQKDFAGFLEKTGIPYVTMMLGKTVLSEHSPQFIGLFEGDRSRDYVRNRVESADCILHDFILGLTVKLSRRDPATLEIQSAAEGSMHRYSVFDWLCSRGNSGRRHGGAGPANRALCRMAPSK